MRIKGKQLPGGLKGLEELQVIGKDNLTYIVTVQDIANLAPSSASFGFTFVMPGFE